MLPFLLLAQVMVGMSPGHAVCIALEACCGGHLHAGVFGEAGSIDLSELHHGDHSHGCADDCAHACCDESDGCDDDCSRGSTHFHLALPDDGGCTRDRSNDHFCDLRLLAPALTVFAIQPVVDLHAQPAPPAPWIWPDCDRAIALETDRLLI